MDRAKAPNVATTAEAQDRWLVFRIMIGRFQAEIDNYLGLEAENPGPGDPDIDAEAQDRWIDPYCGDTDVALAWPSITRGDRIPPPIIPEHLLAPGSVELPAEEMDRAVVGVDFDPGAQGEGGGIVEPGSAESYFDRVWGLDPESHLGRAEAGGLVELLNLAYEMTHRIRSLESDLECLRAEADVESYHTEKLQDSAYDEGWMDAASEAWADLEGPIALLLDFGLAAEDRNSAAIAALVRMQCTMERAADAIKADDDPEEG